MTYWCTCSLCTPVRPLPTHWRTAQVFDAVEAPNGRHCARCGGDHKLSDCPWPNPDEAPEVRELDPESDLAHLTQLGAHGLLSPRGERALQGGEMLRAICRPEYTDAQP